MIALILATLTLAILKTPLVSGDTEEILFPEHIAAEQEPVYETVLEAPLAIQLPEEVWDDHSLVPLINIVAKEYGVNAERMVETIRCETQFRNIQSELTYKPGNRWGMPVGSREQSYGIVQIHIPDNPEVTIEQAFDTTFSINFMAQKFAEGRAGMWTCYRKKFH